MSNIKNPLLVVCGPTATGKSALVIEIAKQFNGEVISADSRQVYRGLDVGAAKITAEEMQGIPHHLIDVTDLDHIFTVAEFQELAKNAIADIHSRGKLPIICGGTGMYISAVVDDKQFPKVEPNLEFRKDLELQTTEELFEKLLLVNPERAETIDRHNKVRLIRAIEIANATLDGEDPLHVSGEGDLRSKSGEVVIIGLTLPKEELIERIQKRIDARIPALFGEIKKLLAKGVSEERLDSFGLEYKYGLQYVNGNITLDEFKATLVTKTWQYVRRQYTWLKKDPRIQWMNPIADHDRIIQVVQNFLA